MAAETLKGDDYKTNFDIDWYVKFYYSTPMENPEEGDTTYTFLLDELHKTFSSGKVSGKRFLEFGSGPTVHTLFSARNAVEEMTCCEFAECSRKQIEKWWKKRVWRI
ncbi:unnamed protein product [Owenia fusiformis]|uniref:Uncharacterized protein n=1 Tax=Owenia fusiformis TaxID=6347 RepID=A0A8J1TGE9_OWEFU|nr:unnamed protein product [Owenia fusiformis]